MFPFLLFCPCISSFPFIARIPDGRWERWLDLPFHERYACMCVWLSRGVFFFPLLSSAFLCALCSDSVLSPLTSCGLLLFVSFQKIALGSVVRCFLTCVPALCSVWLHIRLVCLRVVAKVCVLSFSPSLRVAAVCASCAFHSPAACYVSFLVLFFRGICLRWEIDYSGQQNEADKDIFSWAWCYHRCLALWQESSGGNNPC